MFPKARFSVGKDLFAYRGVVLMALYEPREEKSEGETIMATHFARTFGITASSYSAAAHTLERASGRAPDEMGRAVEGYIDEMEITMMDPAEVAEELGDDLSFFDEGVHYCSEKLFFTEQDLEDEEDGGDVVN